ncbi:MAG TPA: ATP-binding protein [Bryobacteraceae bacterium]|nr:ATP-binding protein [Bryobacteraceae bacterium]
MRNPYPGPRPFSADEYRIFAGRDHEISELTSLIVSHQVVLLYAQSGAGKTSLVNAGLKVPLEERDVYVLSSARVGIPVDEGVRLSDVANVYTYSATGDLFPETADEGGWRQNATLLEAFSRLPEAKNEFGESALRLFILDQFEEIFNAYPQRWQDRTAFFEQLAELLRNYRELRVLLVLREDYLAAFNELAPCLPESARTRYHLERLREPEAVAAVKKPLEGTSTQFDTGVAETMVQDLMTITVVDPTGEAVTVPGEFIEPVQLQVVCFTLFDRMPKDSSLITIEEYRQFGDPDQALESFYKDAVAAAVAATAIDEGELREWCESKLITPAGTRGLVFQGRGKTGGIDNRLVEILEQRHLIRPEIRSGSRWYELTHDRFIRPIQRSNLAWKAERWSKSFEVQYADAISEAATKTGVSQDALRAFLDSLISSGGVRMMVEPADVPEDALGILVGAGLLRREDDGARGRYSIVSDGVAEAVRLANQSWRGENWPEVKRLRELQSRAERWVIDGSKNPSLLLAREEIRGAQKLLATAKVSGVGFNDALNVFVAATLTREAHQKLRWALIACALFGTLAITSFFVSASAEIRWKIFACSITAFGAAVGLAAANDDRDLAHAGLRFFTLLLVFSATLGLLMESLYHWLPTWIVVPIGLVIGFFGCAFALGTAAALLKKQT